MSSKKLKAKNGKVDFISTLPDDVLAHILSFLPTEDAVETSILSTRWKYPWTSIHNLQFDSSFRRQRKREHNGDKSCFVKFVDRVLGLCQSQNIQKFHLHYYGFKPSDLPCVHRWISFAVNRNVRELELCIPNGNKGPVKLPKCISTCKSLVVLELNTDSLVFDIPSSVACFPSLKFLLVSAEYPDGGLMEKLFGSCPVLEDLEVHGYFNEIYKNPITFNISVPTMKKLTIVNETLEEELQYCTTFVVRTPNLEYFKIEDDYIVCFIEDEMPFLIEAYVDVGHYPRFNWMATKDEANRLTELLRGINNTKSLELMFPTVAALSYAFDDNLPSFPNLTHLKLGIVAFLGWNVLPHFLKNSPKLEALVLRNEPYGSLFYPNEDESDKELVEEGYDWIPPENVPSCLLFHLKTIHIEDIKGEEDEHGVIKYLLKNGLVLERMSVKFYPDGKRDVYGHHVSKGIQELLD